MIQCELVCRDTGEEDAAAEVVRVFFLRRAAKVEVVADMTTPTLAQTRATVTKLFRGKMVKYSRM